MKVNICIVAALISTATPANAACDVVQLATNLIWCWTTQHNNIVTSCKNSTNSVGCAVGTRTHQNYVDGITAAYKNKEWQKIRGQYEACQSQNPGALQYLDSCNSEADTMRAATNAIACYPPVKGGDKRYIGVNSRPDWSEAASAGLTTCPPL